MGRERAPVAPGHKSLVLVYELPSAEAEYDGRLNPEEAA
jgi:hypothetical protein